VSVSARQPSAPASRLLLKPIQGVDTAHGATHGRGEFGARIILIRILDFGSVPCVRVAWPTSSALRNSPSAAPWNRVAPRCCPSKTRVDRNMGDEKLSDGLPPPLNGGSQTPGNSLDLVWRDGDAAEVCAQG
jgi:hypothetical protein